MFSTRGDSISFTLKTVESRIDAEHGLRHERVLIAFRDWMDRPCEVYAEALIPDGALCPGVIHCVGGAQTISYDDLLYWARRDYACASFDWQIEGVPHRPPEKTSRWPSEVNVQYQPTLGLENAILPVALQAGRCVISWLAGFDQVDASRLGMSGISWGGYLTWLIAANDSRLTAIAPVYGCGVFGRYSEAWAMKNSPAVNQYWQAYWDPSALAEKQTAAVCYLSATNDFYGNLEEADALLAKLAVPNRSAYLPNCDHSLGKSEAALAAAWMQHYLQEGDPLPEAPVLHDDLTLCVDESQPVERTEIWWTASSCAPRYACWHLGTPKVGSFHLAFAKVYYADGYSLCSALLKSDVTDAVNYNATWPDLRFGTGWRWELGSTQLYENEVIVEPIGEGQRVRFRAQVKTPEHPISISLYQINEPHWRPRSGEHLQLGWQQEGEAPSMQAAFILVDERGEIHVDCEREEAHYLIRLPENLSWRDVLGLRISINLPRVETFVLGPLSRGN